MPSQRREIQGRRVTENTARDAKAVPSKKDVLNAGGQRRWREKEKNRASRSFRPIVPSSAEWGSEEGGQGGEKPGRVTRAMADQCREAQNKCLTGECPAFIGDEEDRVYWKRS